MKELIKNLLRESLLPETSNGNGYEYYHGSETKINTFVDEFVGGKEATDQNGPGIYFTSSILNAGYYGKFIYKVILKPKKLVSVNNSQNASPKEIEWLIRQAPEWEDTAQNWSENPEKGIKIAVNDFIKYNENPHEQFQQVWFDFYRYAPVDYVRNMVKLGYDAIIVSGMESIISGEKEISHMIVLNPLIIEPLELITK